MPEIHEAVNLEGKNNLMQTQDGSSQSENGAVGERPMVSIITVVFNGEACLEKTILSVSEQNYNNLEYIIIDGGSTDSTVACIKKYEQAVNYWISEPDRGISDAFNKGLKRASGEWILLLNAGDCFLRPDAVEAFARHFNGSSRIVTAFAKTSSGIMPERVLENSDDLRKRSMISHQATMVHRMVYDKVGLYGLSYKIRMDYEFWMRALKLFDFKFLDEILIDYAPDGISARNETRYYLEEHRVNMVRCQNPKQFIGAMIRYVKMSFEIWRRSR